MAACTSFDDAQDPEQTTADGGANATGATGGTIGTGAMWAGGNAGTATGATGGGGTAGTTGGTAGTTGGVGGTSGGTAGTAGTTGGTAGTTGGTAGTTGGTAGTTGGTAGTTGGVGGTMGGSTGAGALSAECPEACDNPPPSTTGESCATATVITRGEVSPTGTISGSTCMATNDESGFVKNGTPCADDGPDRVYRVFIPGGSILDVDITRGTNCDGSPGTWTPKLKIHGPEQGCGHKLCSFNDWCGPATPQSSAPRFSTGSDGWWYFVIDGETAADRGNFTLTIDPHCSGTCGC